MDEEDISRKSSERASSEATLLAKEPFNEEDPKTSYSQSFWRQWILTFCIHFIIFLTYTTLILFVLNPRPRDERHIDSVLYCMSISKRKIFLRQPIFIVPVYWTRFDSSRQRSPPLVSAEIQPWRWHYRSILRISTTWARGSVGKASW